MANCARNQLKRLVDLLPDEDLPVAARLLLGLVALARDPAVGAPLAPPAARRLPGGIGPPPHAGAPPRGDPLVEHGPEAEAVKRIVLGLLDED